MRTFWGTDWLLVLMKGDQRTGLYAAQKLEYKIIGFSAHVQSSTGEKMP